MEEDKTEQLRQSWKYSKWLIIAPVVLVLFFILYFVLAGTDNIPAEESLQESEAVTQVKSEFAKDTPLSDVDLEEIEVHSEESQEWPDGCLGLSEPDEFCTQQIVDGYRINLEYEADTQTYRGTYRTDAIGTEVRQESFSVE